MIVLINEKKISNGLICHSSITGPLDMWISKLKKTWFMQG